MIVLVYCILSLFNCIIFVFSPIPYVIYFLLLWHDIAYLCAESAVNTNKLTNSAISL